MPDKHEVGGSSPLGPTKKRKAFLMQSSECRVQNGRSKNGEKQKPNNSALCIQHCALNYGGVAQLGEHLPCKQGVMGSNPIISTSRQRSAEMFIENRIKKKETKQIVVY